MMAAGNSSANTKPEQDASSDNLNTDIPVLPI
jgi:hypothetical protein